MNSNVLPFTGMRNAVANRVVATAQNNVVSMVDWKRHCRAKRTAFGVFFMTQVLCTPGDAA